MSSDHGPALADLLVMVPDLLPSYILPQWRYQTAGVKSLRLVSKDVGAVAMRTVDYCSIKLGKSPSLPVEQVASLMEQVVLKSMSVSVDLSRTNDNIDSSMLSPYIHDMHCLVTGAPDSIKHVTSLFLDVKRKLLDKAAVKFPPLKFFPLIVPSSKAVDYRVPRTAFAMLAAAVPRLQKLQTSTRYGDVDLAAFGTHCLDLRELSMQCDALSLQGIDTALPNLTTLHLSSMHVMFRKEDHVKEYVERACLLLRGCSSLVSVTMNFHTHTPVEDEQLECSEKVWEQLPDSLVEFHTNTSFTSLHKAEKFMGRVRALSLGQMAEDCSSLPELLLLAPQLERLAILQPDEPGDFELELMWHADISEADLDQLKERLVSGFQLSCTGVSFTGRSQSVADGMSWMSPLKDTVNCRLCFKKQRRSNRLGDSFSECLSQLSRVCPAVDYLVLGFAFIWGDTPHVSEEVFAHVMACKGLVRLDVYIWVKFTHAGLVNLCMSLPKLIGIFFQPCEGVSCEHVMAELALKGREVHLAEIVEFEDLPNAFEV